MIDGVVHWVDLLRGELYAWTPGTEQKATLQRTVNAALGFIEKAPDGRLIGAVGTGLSWLREDGTAVELATTGLDGGRHRVNDGSFAPDGSCWFGTMVHDDSEAEGHVWRWDPASGEVTNVMSGLEIPNGPIFYPEIDAMLIADTTARKILSKKLTPEVSLEPFATIDGGWPDGMHVDSRGQLWNAIWGGKRVDVYATATSAAESIAVPVSQPTSVLVTSESDPLVIVTSASQGLTDPAELDGHTIVARLSQL